MGENITITVNKSLTIPEGIHNIKLVNITSHRLDFSALNAIIHVEKDGIDLINKKVLPYLPKFHNNLIYFAGEEFDILQFNECKITLVLSDKSISDSCNLHYLIL